MRTPTAPAPSEICVCVWVASQTTVVSSPRPHITYPTLEGRHRFFSPSIPIPPSLIPPIPSTLPTVLSHSCDFSFAYSGLKHQPPTPLFFSFPPSRFCFGACFADGRSRDDDRPTDRPTAQFPRWWWLVVGELWAARERERGIYGVTRTCSTQTPPPPPPPHTHTQP